MKSSGELRQIFLLHFRYTPWSIKTGHYTIGGNFIKCKPIFTIFAPL